MTDNLTAETRPTHTRGPWEFRQPYGAGTRTFAVYANGHGYIVQPHSKTANPVVDSEHEANCHLMAAAPDLLAALRVALRAPGIHTTDQVTGETFAYVIGAAIDKATGHE